MSDLSDERDPVDLLAEEFVNRLRSGQRPSVTEYADRCPQRADDIRDLFPALVEMEQLKPVTADNTGAYLPAAEPSDPLRVGEFRILRRVGFGGMGVVYEAMQESLGRHVALKLLPTEALADVKRLERFRREAKAAARLHHTNIVPVFGTGEADGRHFYAMQFIAGHPLDAVIDEVRQLQDRSGSPAPARAASAVAAAMMTGTFRASRAGEPNDNPSEPSVSTAAISALSGIRSTDGQPLGSTSGSLQDTGRPYWQAVARIGAEVADALAYAHAQGILHRDIKPSNLLLDLHGTVWVTDFGLAKASDTDDLTRTGDVVGTLRYMAPERFDGPGDHRADIYALGLTLYEMLTLRPAFVADARPKLIELVLTAAAPAPRRVRPAIPRDLETIVLKATARDPGMRYQTAAEMAEDLRRFLEDRPIQARRASASEQAWRWCRRNPAMAGLLATVLLVFASGAVAASFFAFRADREAARATTSEAQAVAKAQEAAAAADEAARDRDEAHNRLIRLYVSSGARYQDAGDLPSALLWFQKAWDQDPNDPRAEASHRARIAGILAELPDLLGACFSTAKVCGAVFSPDGELVLTRSDRNDATLWDYQKLRPAVPPLVHSARVRHICFNADGSLIATASADGTAAIWDAKTGARRFVLKHDGPLTCVAFHPGDGRIVTAAEDKSVRLWAAADGKQLDWKLPVNTVVDYLAFSPDGSQLLLCNRDRTAQVWSLEAPAPLSPPMPHETPGDVQRYEYNYQKWPRFSPDGKQVVSFQEKDLYLWSAGDPQQVRKIADVHANAVLETYFIPNSNRIFVTGAGPMARAIDLDTGKVELIFNHPRNCNIGGVSPDGKWLITSSSGGLVHVWSAADGKPAGPVLRCGDFCSIVTFSADSSRYLAASQDGTVRVWAAGAREPTSRPYQFDCGRANFLAFPNADKSSYRTFSPDGSRQVEWRKDGAIQLLHGPDAPAKSIGFPVPATVATFCDDGSRFVVDGGDMVRAFDAASGEPVGPVVKLGNRANQLSKSDTRPEARRYRINQVIRPYHMSRDGARLIVWDDEKTVSVWDLVTGQRVFGPARHPNPGPVIFQSPVYDGWVTWAALSPDGRRLAAGIDSSGTVSVWDVDTGQLMHHNRRYRGGMIVMLFSDDSRRVLVSTGDNKAHVYDVESGAPVGPSVLQPGNARGSDVDPEGRRLAVYDKFANAVRVWDVERGERLLTLWFGDRQVSQGMWFSRNGQSLNVVIESKGVYTYPLPHFEVPTAKSGPLVRFMTGLQIDEGDGIEFVDQFTFRNDPELYRGAVAAWKGVALDK